MPSLPSSWVSTNLGSLTNPNIEKSGPRSGGFTYVDIGSIDNETKRVAAPKTLDVSEAPSRARQRLEPGDVIVSMTRPNLNAVALIGPREGEVIGSTGFHVLRPILIDPRWIFYAVQTRDFVEAMCRRVQGALYPAVRPRDIEQYSVAVAPRGEQRRICDELDKHFTRLEVSIAALRRIRTAVMNQRASMIDAACRGRLNGTREVGEKGETGQALLERILTAREEAFASRQRAFRSPVKPEGIPFGLPPHWTWASWDQLSIWITYGFTRPMPHVPRGIPIVTAKNVADGRINLTDTRKTTRKAFGDLSEKDRPRLGDILITKDGTIGRSAIVRSDEKFCINQSVAVAWPAWKRLNLDFLQLTIESPTTQNLIRDKARGVAIQHLSITDFAKFPVPFPPLHEQKHIVEIIDAHLSVLLNVNALVHSAEKRAVQLRQSLLDRAFAGKLVSQDPSDEAAAVLLNEIARELEILIRQPRVAKTLPPTPMPNKPVKTLQELMQRLVSLGGSASAARLLTACKLEADVETFFDLLRVGKTEGRLHVPVGKPGAIRLT